MRIRAFLIFFGITPKYYIFVIINFSSMHSVCFPEIQVKLSSLQIVFLGYFSRFLTACGPNLAVEPLCARGRTARGRRGRRRPVAGPHAGGRRGHVLHRLARPPGLWASERRQPLCGYPACLVCPRCVGSTPCSRWTPRDFPWVSCFVFFIACKHCLFCSHFLDGGR